MMNDLEMYEPVYKKIKTLDFELVKDELDDDNRHAEKAWDSMFDRLFDYRALNGDCLVPRKYKADPKLGNWVSKQRAHRSSLSAERISRLESIGFVWCVTTRETWETMFSRLLLYKSMHGDCLVPFHYEEDPKLVTWVYKQRAQRKKGSLTRERFERLDEIGFVWFPQRNLWDAMYALLIEYKMVNGHCNVPREYEEDQELSDWVYAQHRNKEKLSTERRGRLEELGFEWNPVQQDKWDVMYERLLKYKLHHGDCLVPHKYQQDPKLGRWVNTQRRHKDTLLPERRELLDSIGFVWMVVRREPWNVMFDRLVEYKRQKGDCLVPQRYKEDPRLGGWVREQRKRQDSLSPDRRLLLQSIGFAWRAKAPTQSKMLPEDPTLSFFLENDNFLMG